jgi:hypothetical protein
MRPRALVAIIVLDLVGITSAAGAAGSRISRTLGRELLCIPLAVAIGPHDRRETMEEDAGSGGRLPAWSRVTPKSLRIASCDLVIE